MTQPLHVVLDAYYRSVQHIRTCMENGGFVFDYRVVGADAPPHYDRYRAVDLLPTRNELWAVNVEDDRRAMESAGRPLSEEDEKAVRVRFSMWNDLEWRREPGEGETQQQYADRSKRAVAEHLSRLTLPQTEAFLMWDKLYEMFREENEKRDESKQIDDGAFKAMQQLDNQGRDAPPADPSATASAARVQWELEQNPEVFGTSVQQLFRQGVWLRERYNRIEFVRDLVGTKPLPDEVIAGMVTTLEADAVDRNAVDASIAQEPTGPRRGGRRGDD